MTLTEPADTVYLRGHNCKIEIGSGNTISNLYISGHNNKVFSKDAGSDVASFGVVGFIGALKSAFAGCAPGMVGVVDQTVP